jgi:hypothetical protein
VGVSRKKRRQTLSGVLGHDEAGNLGCAPQDERETATSVAFERTERRQPMNDPEIEEYNYSDFVGSEFLPFRTHLPVGSAAPDFQATLLEPERPVQLSDYWKKGDLLIEFGSLT